MMMRSIIPLLTISLLAAGCVKQPKACFEPPEVIEAGTELTLESCSENYEFLTWDFGDQSTGFIGEDAPHTYHLEGSYAVTLTAYGDGGYRSDEVTQIVKASYRYIDRFEVVGTSSFNRFIIEALGSEWNKGGASGTFTDDAPYTLQIWPEEEVEMGRARGTEITLIGLTGNVPTTLATGKFNFTSFKENPAVVTGPDFTLKMYWTYRPVN